MTDWHLDKKVPIAIIFTLAVQLGTAIWWSAKLDSRVAVLEIQAKQQSNLAERVVRLETLLESINNNLEEIKDSLRNK